MSRATCDQHKAGPVLPQKTRSDHHVGTEGPMPRTHTHTHTRPHNHTENSSESTRSAKTKRGTCCSFFAFFVFLFPFFHHGNEGRGCRGAPDRLSLMPAFVVLTFLCHCFLFFSERNEVECSFRLFVCFAFLLLREDRRSDH